MVRLRLHEPFRISSGVTHHRRILLVKVDAGGLRGYGECVAEDTPHYGYETVETALYVLRGFLIPALLNARTLDPGAAGAVLDSAAKGHPMAKAALEMALWDLAAKRHEVPLSRLLGGVKDRVAAGVSIGIQESVPALLERIHGYIAEGYQRIKIKIAPGWDESVVRAVRAELPDVPLMVDANCAYTLADAGRLRALDDFGLMMIEQPLGMDDLLEHAELQRGLRTAICLDESVTSSARCAEALHLKSGRIVNIKPGRVGGHTAAIGVHDLCAEAGVPVWCGGMLESGIGRAHNVALASLPNFTLPGDTSASRRYWARDVVHPEFELQADGTIAVPVGAGIGVEVDEDYLSAIEESCESFSADRAR